MPKRSKSRRRRKTPTRKSRKGMIWRKGYTRKGYTRSNGRRVKGVRVKGGWIRSTSPYKGKRSAWAKKVRSATKRRQRSASRRTSGPKRCPQGYTRRAPYLRKSYRRKSGKRVKRAVVAAKCVKRPRSGRRSKVRIGPLRKGTLRQYGYSTSKTAQSRHRALAKAVKGESALSVFRKLNAVMVLTKNRSPGASAKFRSDRNWVKRTYGV